MGESFGSASAATAASTSSAVYRRSGIEANLGDAPASQRQADQQTGCAAAKPAIGLASGPRRA
jgi:hypothetical protein